MDLSLGVVGVRLEAFRAEGLRVGGYRAERRRVQDLAVYNSSHLQVYGLCLIRGQILLTCR